MSLNRLLVVEDQPQDIRLAANTAESIGIREVEARTSAQAARNYLDDGLRGDCPLPDGILLDLNLGYESGYELLRYWHSEPRLSKIPLIVWSVLGDEQRHMCGLFHVDRYVAKWEGPEAIREALDSLGQSAS
jgi:CheY-like chemotaxis protein